MDLSSRYQQRLSWGLTDWVVINTLLISREVNNFPRDLPLNAVENLVEKRFISSVAEVCAGGLEC